MLKIQDISFKLKNGRHILNKVSFDIGMQQILGILGPSGSGKSTILRVIAGLITPTKGKILLHENDILIIPVNKRPISLLQQSFPLYKNLTVFQNTEIALESETKLSKSVVKKQSIELLNKLGILEEFFKRNIENLSGGEAQRVALAKALLKPCKILMLDEPFSNIDKNKKRYLNQLVREVVRERNLIGLYVSHDENDLLLMSDELVVMDEGRIIQQGKPDELIKNPKSSKVAAIGSNVGLQIIEVDNLTEMNDEQRILHSLPNNCIKIGWRPECSLLFLNEKWKEPTGSSQLKIDVKINRISKISNFYYINLLTINLEDKKIFWHLEYSHNNDFKSLQIGQLAHLIIDMNDIFFLDTQENVLRKGNDS